VALERILGAYSGGAVLDFHQLPNYSARVLLKASLDYQNEVSKNKISA
jgi:hypothetical protein